MACKNRNIYRFLGTSWVLITVAPRKYLTFANYFLVGENTLPDLPNYFLVGDSQQKLAVVRIITVVSKYEHRLY